MSLPRGALRRFPAREAAWLVLALAGLAALGAAMAQAHSARARTEHADRVLLRSSELERKVVDLETGLRGYAITRDQVFLRPMLAAQRGIPDELEALEVLVQGNAAQERRAKAISEAVWTYGRYWLKPAVRLEQSDSTLAAQMWASVGRERMEAIRRRFAAFERAEQGIRDSSAGDAATADGFVAGIMAALLVSLAAGLALTLRRQRGGVAAAVGDLEAKLEQSDARNDELLEELQRQSLVDRLTGIANRDAFVERLEAECAAARRHCGDFSVLLLDVVGLGRINQAQGYAAGNAVLLRIVALCTAQLRSGDLVARVGGDELGILLPRTPAHGAEVVADALRRKVAAEPIVEGGAAIAVRVSVGVASAAHGAEAGALLAAAERDLAERKSPVPHLTDVSAAAAG